MSDSIAFRILMIMTSHGQVGQTGRKTGLWLESFVAPYFLLRDAGVELTLASPCGGMPPIDPISRQVAYPAAERFAKDECCRAALADTLPLSDIFPADFHAAFICGGQGAYWDLAQDENLATLIGKLYDSSRPLGFVGAGIAALASARDERGRPVVESKRIASFPPHSAQAAIADDLPSSLEQRLRELGALLEFNSTGSFVSDGLLLTCPLDSASEGAAQEILRLIQSATPN